MAFSSIIVAFLCTMERVLSFVCTLQSTRMLPRTAPQHLTTPVIPDVMSGLCSGGGGDGIRGGGDGDGDGNSGDVGGDGSSSLSIKKSSFGTAEIINVYDEDD